MDDNIECTEEERCGRLDVCKTCTAFTIKEEQMTECSECNCSIAYMVGFKFKICPKGNWE